MAVGSGVEISVPKPGVKGADHLVKVNTIVDIYPFLR